MYIAALVVPIRPKLLLNFCFRRPTMTKPSLNTEIQSKRDISKNYLILQCIKHKLILKMWKKMRDYVFITPKRTHWKLFKHKSNEMNDPIYEPIINHIFFFLYILEQKMILIFQMSTTKIKNRVKYYFGP